MTRSLAPGSTLAALLAGKAAVVIGPGIGTTSAAAARVREVLGAGIPAVLDADALNLLAADPSSIALAAGPVVLTPHPGEASRLLGIPIANVEADRLAAARALAARTRAVVVLKGARTIVCDGRSYNASDRTSADASDRTSADASDRTSADASDRTSADASDRTSADASEATSADASDRTSADASDRTSADASDRTSADASDRTSADASDRTSADASAGLHCSINPSGGPALATGGSGDVLAGTIGALLAQGLSAVDAARAGVFVHGAAGDQLAEVHGARGVLSSDLPTAIASAIRTLSSQR
jgi:NAD(P)H-hydrate repair Nnr-like enzyme with NAD(P)H-hydrate dehydratase domain